MRVVECGSHVIWTTQNMDEKRGRSDGILISHPIHIETWNFYRSRTLGGFGDQTKEVYPARDDTQLFCPNNFKQFWTEHFPQTAVNAGSTLQVTQLEYSFRLLLNKLPFFWTDSNNGLNDLTQRGFDRRIQHPGEMLAGEARRWKSWNAALLIAAQRSKRTSIKSLSSHPSGSKKAAIQGKLKRT